MQKVIEIPNCGSAVFVAFLLPFILLVTLTHSLAWPTAVPASIITWCQLVKMEVGVAVHHEIMRLSMHASSVVVYWLCTQQSSSHVPQILSCWEMRAASQYGISCGPVKEAGCYDALSVNHFLHISFQSIICFLMIRKRINSKIFSRTKVYIKQDDWYMFVYVLRSCMLLCIAMHAS